MKKIVLLLTACLLVSTSVRVSAQEQEYRKFLFFKIKKNSTKKARKKSKYEKLFAKKHTKVEGLFTLHLMNNRIYFEMPIDLMGREMLIGSTISKISDNAHAVIGSKPYSPLHVEFTKTDSHVQLREVNLGFIADKGLRKGDVQANSRIPSIIENSEILAYSPDSTAVVFDMTKFFVGNNKKMYPFDDVALIGRVKRREVFKPQNSYPISVKAFKDNVTITSMLSYTYTLSLGNGAVIAKDSPFSAEMTRSIVLLDKEPYRPRLADYRIGIFNSAREMLASGAKTSRYVRYARRWNLQPKDTVAYRQGRLVEPIKPIVFYMDNTFPKQWVPYIKEGVMQWNELFQEIGFKNAIQVKPFPTKEEDPEFDPDNIKYSCIRYAPSNFQNAMGPSWVDPRSGEIITASVYVYHDVVKLLRRWLFIQTAQADKNVRTVNPPEKDLGDALRYVIAHEVGHCLGFMHNMIASNSIAVDSLRSPEFTQKYGTTHSIMDYARFNYVAQPGDKERGVKLTPPRFGVYDRYLVRWNYTPIFEAKTIEDEAKITSKWITDALAQSDYYRYGKQQFTGILDPRSQSEDLGHNAVQASSYGIKNLKYIAGNLDTWITTDDDDFSFRRNIYAGIIDQLFTYIRHVANNVGGYKSNNVKSQDKTPRYEPLSKHRQREALNFLIALYDDLEWLDTAPVLKKISVSGSPKHFIQSILSRIMFNLPMRVSRYENMSAESYQSAETFKTIYDFVWNSKGGRAKNLSKDYADLQVSFLKNLTGIVKATKRHPSGVSLREDFDKELSTLLGAKLEHSDFCASTQALSSDVLGFEQVPNDRYVQTRITKADIYAYIMQVKGLVKQRIKNTSGDTKAHYQVLLNLIEADF